MFPMCAALVISAALAVVCAELHPLSDEFIAETNAKATTWVAERHFNIEDWEHVKKLVNGVVKDARSEAEKAKLPKRVHGLTAAQLPEYFDSAENWPQCESIREIRDQSRCGSCWAFAAVEAMSDRICIHSNSTLQTRVSARDLTTCCASCGMGCLGGAPVMAWNYWTTEGIVTGGLYGHTDQGCQAYFLPECEDHTHKCTDYKDTPRCSKECDNPSISFQNSKTYGIKGSISIFDVETEIQAEIMKNGPVEAAFDVQADFVNYKSGIYQPTSSQVLGGHAVKIVGWGVENGVKYWKIANSWNPRWGENGYFRIIRGKNAVGIESDVEAGLPKLD